MARVELAFLWHMHQPPYRDPVTGEYLLPWVRLHATRAYLDLAAIHERFPEVRGTVNFVPSLLAQLEDYAAGTARDRFLELTLRAPDDLTAEERTFVVRNFFMVSWPRSIDPVPRYAELLDRRGRDLWKVDLDAAAASFRDEDVRDLQVLFNLAWMGFAANDRFPLVRELRAKGRGFTEEEKRALVQVQLEIVRAIEPSWRALGERGQVELTATAYYHPILPLLCDTESARVAMPGAPLPPRLRALDDAHEQVRRARAKFAEVFGRAPSGMWPAEGSVSPEALAVFAAEGVSWVASDEEVLFRSVLPPGVGREGLYRPWRVRAGERELAMVFRDRGLSDLIGFTYSKSAPSAAVDDFLGHLGRIADGVGNVAGAPPLVSVILDGENPWEQYEDSGRPFLEALFSRLAREEGGVRTTTIGARTQTLPAEAPRIERIHSGSWIEANYRIWIGHEEDVAAWTLVHGAHERLRAHREGGRTSPEALRIAAEHLLAAEASDWFWWYGPDFSTDSAAEFDALFRSHVQAVYRALGERPPPLALTPIPAHVRAREALMLQPPVGLLSPVIDGFETSYPEWRGAGRYLPRQERGGAMHARAGAVGLLHFGFDRRCLYLRLDPATDPAALLARADRLRLTLETPHGAVEVGALLTPGPLALEAAGAEGEPGVAAFHATVEVALLLSALRLSPGDPATLVVRLSRAGHEVERLPRTGALRLEVPGEDFERRNWKV